MIINQAYLFLVFTIDGIIIGLFFDIFRILRKAFKTANIITYVEDVLFWVLTGISIIFCIYVFAYGIIRFYMIFGILVGIFFYMLTLSRIIIKIFVSVILILKKVICKLFKLVYLPFKKPVQFLYIILIKILRKKRKFFKLRGNYEKT